MYEFQVTIKNQESGLINTIPVQEQHLNEKWAKLIEDVQSRYDYILMLERRFVDRNPSREWLNVWKQQKEQFLLVTEQLVIGKWETIAKVNTKEQLVRS